jgi:hypothetical protein
MLLMLPIAYEAQYHSNSALIHIIDKPYMVELTLADLETFLYRDKEGENRRKFDSLASVKRDSIHLWMDPEDLTLLFLKPDSNYVE